MKTILLSSICLLFVSTGPLLAQTVEITPFGGYRFGGEVADATTGAKYGFEDSPAYGLFLDWGPAKSDAKVELLWSRQDSSLNFHGAYGLNKVGLTIDEIQLGGLAEMGHNRFREYVSAHVGATYFSTDNYGSDTRFSLGIGAGAKFFVTKNIVLRADLRGFCTVVDSESALIYYNGVTVARFSGSTLWQGQATIGVGVAF